MDTKSQEQLLTPENVTTVLNVSKATFRRLIDSGQLPFVRVVGQGKRGQIRIRPTALNLFILRNSSVAPKPRSRRSAA